MSFNEALGYFQPYLNTGSGALSSYYNNAAQYANHPQNAYNNIKSGYQLSPAVQYQQHMGAHAIASNNATKGLLGSGQMAKALSDYGQQSTDAYQQQYLKNILGIQNEGMSGLGNLSNLGYQSANSMAQLQEAINQINAMKNTSLLNGLFDFGGNILGDMFKYTKLF